MPPKSLIKGTSVTVRFHYAVDGDTIRVYLPDAEKSESIRILCLDTEESFSFGSKPKTPWGSEAKKFAREFFEGVETVTLEFSGNEALATAFTKYRGNFGRLLAFVYKDGVDFQEIMIRKGYSPYFNKYGNAPFASHHVRYQEAERQAQIKNIGVWDQVGVNGYVARDYALLKVWWDLRAARVDHYRKLKEADKTVYNTRLDYDKLVELAENGAVATVFTEVSYVRRTSGSVGIIDIGSDSNPFAIKIPDMDSANGRKIIALLRTRYIGSENKPALGYCFATGRLEKFRGSPHMEILNSAAITDTLGLRAEVAGPLLAPAESDEEDTVMTPSPDEPATSGCVTVCEGVDLAILSCLPDPIGTDRGRETVTLRNRGRTEALLDGWTLKDRVGQTEKLKGTVPEGGTFVIRLNGKGVRLNNTGDELFLYSPDEILVSNVEYRGVDVNAGQTVEF